MSILRPNRRKDKHKRRDLPYMAWIKAQPCLCCEPGNQKCQTEAAHVGDRGLGQKCSDRETLPLCAYHHRLDYRSIHSMGKLFWSWWGFDRDELVAEFTGRYEREAT